MLVGSRVQKSLRKRPTCDEPALKSRENFHRMYFQSICFSEFFVGVSRIFPSLCSCGVVRLYKYAGWVPSSFPKENPVTEKWTNPKRQAPVRGGNTKRGIAYPLSQTYFTVGRKTNEFLVAVIFAD